MKKVLTTVIALVMLFGFIIYIQNTEKFKEVLKIASPTKIGIDLNKNGMIEPNEFVCIDNIETFSLEVTTDFYNKYSKELNLNKVEMISLGYLAEEFAQDILLNKKVIVKFTPKITTECKYANVYINGVNYRDILSNSGFSIAANKIKNENNFKQNLEKARKLDLVILNHHSNKYHTLDCEYAKIAHDTVIIPKKHLPKDAFPCKYCNKKKAYRYKKDKDIFEVKKLKEPLLTISNGKVTHFYTNFTTHLKPDNRCSSLQCREFVKLVDNSKDSIDLALYGYSDVPDVTAALKKAKSRGVKIRLVYDDNSTGETYYTDNSILINLADEIKSDKVLSIKETNFLMHNKFVIFDRETVFTGSMNFSTTGFSSYNQNDIIILNSKDIAEYYEIEFEQMLSGKFHNNKIAAPNNVFSVLDSTIEIYFSPKYKQSSRIIQLIQESKQYIYMPTFLITHKGIADELVKAHKRGVDIRIIIDANNIYLRGSKHKMLKDAGILIKGENYAGKLHSKSMIIDDEYIVTGSMNFSNSGENSNDENTLIIRNTQLAKNYKNYFNYLWEIIPDRYLKFNPKAEGKDSIGSCSDGIDNDFDGKIDMEDEACQ